MSHLDARQLLVAAGRRWLRHPWVLLGFAVAGGGTAGLCDVLVAAATGDPMDGFRAGSVLGGLTTVAATSGMLRIVHARETGAGVRWGAAALDGIELFFPVTLYRFFTAGGLLLGVVPGLWYGARWAVVWPVWVIERKGFDRCDVLTDGHRWPLLAAWVVSSLIVGAAWAGFAFGIGTAEPVARALQPAWQLLWGWLPVLVGYEAWRQLAVPAGDGCA